MHAALINALGGNTSVAKALGLPKPVVCNWSARNRIPWPHRKAFAELALTKGVEVPPDFFGAGKEHAA